jgi:protoporphyrinogen oxidase
MQKKAIIIGAGPAGLTAAYELLTRTDIIPIILEKSGDIGGISKTVNYKGNRMDIGGHRFFSKSDRVMEWWLNMMPIEPLEEKQLTIAYRRGSRTIKTPDGANSEGPGDKVMLLRNRLSRIYFLRKFFSYPIQLSLDTLRKLGLARTLGILLSYTKARLFPRKPEKSLEDFFINRFGDMLYRLFFKDYTEKVWGVPCTKISSEWGAQRIKGISIAKALAHAVKSMKPKAFTGKGDIGQKDTETSLIERFLYPKYGPGQLWEEVARQVQEKGGKLIPYQDVQSISAEDDKITAVTTVDRQTGQTQTWEGDYFFSTMPVKELIAGMREQVPANVRDIAAGLQYRDFITVGVLLRKMGDALPDTWIYIQEKDVKVGRLQIFNNWSPYMVKDPSTVWLGMEYFCTETDDFWKLSDDEIKTLAIGELAKMGLAEVSDVLDTNVLRVEKTYPAYFGTYDRFEEIKEFTDRFANLFLVGRNGMHKYNNSDHSMLTAMVSVDNIAAGVTSKANIWAINTEQDYHEEKTTDTAPDTKPVVSKQPKHPFLVDYLWKNQPNRAWWLVGIAAFLIEFVIFKFHYPFANYMPDSYSYIEAAGNNADVNMWPVAYSKYLRFVSVFTHSDKIVVGLQYLFMQCSALLFVFSLLYLLKPGCGVKTIILLFFVLDPLPLYVANYISADALFIGFSLLWLTTLIWIIYKPRTWMILVHALLLLACFTLRYNALYYPFIAILAFFFSRQSWKTKLAGIAASLLLLSLSFFYTSQKMKDITGLWQFSAFGGWQMANNALYMYEHIPPAQRGPIPVKYATLETMVREHMDTLKRIKFSHDDTVSAHFYLWSGRGPLLQYLAKQYKNDSTTPYFKRWATEAPLYQSYGMYLIKRYPVQFAEEWMFPNALKFAVPPTEFLGIYNMGNDSVGSLAKEWFNYKNRKVQQHDRKKSDEIPATAWFPVFGAMANILLIMGLIGVAFLGAVKRQEHSLIQFLILVLALWLINSGFSIFASPIVLRYQVFPLFVAFVVGALLIERIYKLSKG